MDAWTMMDKIVETKSTRSMNLRPSTFSEQAKTRPEASNLFLFGARELQGKTNSITVSFSFNGKSDASESVVKGLNRLTPNQRRT